MTEEEIRDFIEANIVDNNTGLITPEKVRDVLTAIVVHIKEGKSSLKMLENADPENDPDVLQLFWDGQFLRAEIPGDVKRRIVWQAW